jgi:hypothetical protein
LVNLSSAFNLFEGGREGTGIVFYATRKDLKESILIPYTIDIPEKIIIDGKIIEMNSIDKIIEKTIDVVSFIL